MSQTYSIQAGEEQGAYRISGALTLATATDVMRDSHAQFASAQQLDIDLAEVTRADSAALALLISWMRLAKQQNKPIQFHHLPAQMLAIAKASGLDSILPLN